MKTNINRRDFLKKAGCAALSVSSLATIASCGGNKEKNSSPAELETEGEMTYRTHPQNGDKVSILGYGCMRWPMNEDGATVDQETTNRLVATSPSCSDAAATTSPPGHIQKV